MSAIERRLAKIERQNSRRRTACIWRNSGETADQAVERHLAGRPEDLDAELVVVGWAG